MYALPVAATGVPPVAAPLLLLFVVDTSVPPEEAVFLVEKFSLGLYIGGEEDNDPLSLVEFVVKKLELSRSPPAAPPGRPMVPADEEEEEEFKEEEEEEDEDDLDNLRLSLTVAAFMRSTNSLKLLKLYSSNNSLDIRRNVKHAIGGNFSPVFHNSTSSPSPRAFLITRSYADRSKRHKAFSPATRTLYFAAAVRICLSKPSGPHLENHG